MNNSTGGNKALKEELRFLQNLFGKKASLKISVDVNTHYPHPGEKKVLEIKPQTTFEHLTGFSLCFLGPVSNKLLLESIEIYFSPNTIKSSKHFEICPIDFTKFWLSENLIKILDCEDKELTFDILIQFLGSHFRD